MYGSEVLAISLNHENLDGKQREQHRKRIEKETGLVAFYPLLDGCERAMDAVLGYMENERAR
jgi:uncharacterized NAD-dependent epimerase/dehydratase family protein